MTSVTALAARPNYKWWVVAMLWLISFFNYADRQAIFSVFPLLEREMNLTPVQLGLLGSAFAWVYGLGAPFAAGVLLLTGIVFFVTHDSARMRAELSAS